MSQTQISNDTDRYAAFERLFHDNYPKLYFYVLNIIGGDRDNAEVAEDIVEDVFASLWKHGFPLPPLQSSYLYTMARNKSLDHLRHINVRSKYVEAMEAMGAMEATGQETTGDEWAAEHQERIDRVMGLVAQLPSQTQRVFKACLIDGRKYKDVAEELGISVNTVKTYISRGLAFIRSNMS